jgi:addiction module HigA family antidote
MSDVGWAVAHHCIRLAFYAMQSYGNNAQWRICFRWHNGHAYDVEVVDYHSGPGNMKKLAPVHPGEVLLKDFLDPLGVSQYRLAKDIHVPARRINEIVHGTRAISADTALRLARYFGVSPQFWMNLQAHYDLEVEQDKVGHAIDRDILALRTS